MKIDRAALIASGGVLPNGETGGSLPDQSEDSPTGGAEDTPEEPSEDEPGPDESGEQGDESNDVDEGTDGETEDETETDEGSPETDEDTDEDSPDLTLLALQTRADENAALNAKLVELLGQQTKAKNVVPKADDYADVPDDLLKMALFGAPPEAFQQFPQTLIDRARTAAKAHADRTIKLLRNPAALLEDLKGQIQELVNSRVRPIEDDYSTRRANELAEKHFKKHPKEVQDRVKDVFNSLPGGSSSNWSVIERDLKLAERVALAETSVKGNKADANKRTTQKIQRIAAGGGKLKGSKKVGQGAAPGPKSRPSKRNDESYSQYAARLEKLGWQGE